VADLNGLPQVSWLGKKEYTSLAIRRKRVELRELERLCVKLIKKAQKQLRTQIKMRLSEKLN
jgi:hypothetical protein